MLGRSGTRWRLWSLAGWAGICRAVAAGHHPTTQGANELGSPFAALRLTIQMPLAAAWLPPQRRADWPRAVARNAAVTLSAHGYGPSAIDMEGVGNRQEMAQSAFVHGADFGIEPAGSHLLQAQDPVLTDRPHLERAV